VLAEVRQRLVRRPGKAVHRTERRRAVGVGERVPELLELGRFEAGRRFLWQDVGGVPDEGGGVVTPRNEAAAVEREGNRKDRPLMGL
jgi:hypothetical protein